MTDIQFETHDGLKSAKKAARNEIDGFLDSVYFKEEVLKKYEGDRNYQIGDDGTVQFGSEWGTFRGCYRVAEGIICINLGDLGEYNKRLVWKPPGGLGNYTGYMGMRLYTTENVNFDSDSLIVNIN